VTWLSAGPKRDIDLARPKYRSHENCSRACQEAKVDLEADEVTLIDNTYHSRENQVLSSGGVSRDPANTEASTSQHYPPSRDSRSRCPF